jgi:ketosteroid isomerase-like protein
MTGARCIPGPLQGLLRRSNGRARSDDRRQDDVQLVQAAYRLTLEKSDPQRTARSIDRFLALLSGSVVFVPESGAAGAYRGRQAVRRLLADAAENWNSVRYEIEEMLDLGGGDLVVCGNALARSDVRSRPSEIPFVNRWKIRAGQAVRIESFGDRDEALEAFAMRSRPRAV